MSVAHAVRAGLGLAVGVWLCACLTRVEVGALPAPEAGAGDAASERDASTPMQDADAGPTPLDVLREQILGRWCGVATSNPNASLAVDVTTLIELTFEPETYVVHCRASCALGPFPGERVSDGSEGRYRLTDVTLDGRGWGTAEHELSDGEWTVQLERIKLRQQMLHLERRSATGLVVLDMVLCE